MTKYRLQVRTVYIGSSIHRSLIFKLKTMTTT